MVTMGTVRNGTIVLDDPQAFEEGRRVQVHEAVAEESNCEPPVQTSLLELLKDFVGAAPDLPHDISVQHDHYISGTPKR